MASDVRNLIKLQNDATWKKLSDDGVIVGYGKLDLDWLNLNYNHNEGTEQYAYVKHFPAEYVKFRILDPTKRMKDIQKNLMDSIEKLFDNAKTSLGKLPLSPAKKEEIKKDTVTSPPKTDNGTTIASDGISIELILEGIKFFFGMTRAINDTIGAIGDEMMSANLNADGSLTYIVADYYHGTARNIDHVGAGAIFGGHKNDVETVGKRILSLSSTDKNRVEIQSKTKTTLPFIGLNN